MGTNRIRFEHIALNVDNSIETAQWYRDNLGMKILRGGDVPGSKQFVSDPGGNMMFEFYHTKLAKVPDYSAMHNHELHIAFMVDDVKAACQKLIAAGAKMDGEIVITPEGDEIAIVRDPWGIPIQFVKRATPMFSHN
jgi:catechol 2,3-dioxygenase-like lactoylglutathione lyase family enzyme